MRIEDLDTPCLVLDLDAVETNIERMASSLEGKPARLRPHFKTPKTPEVARRQLDAGAIGITVAKLGEAEVLAEAGLGPVLMANQVVGEQKIDRLMALLASGSDITVAVESSFNVEQLAGGAVRSGQTPSAVVEVDVGMRRCGTASPGETVAVARALRDAGVNYRGLMGYEGHVVLLDDAGERAEKQAAAMAIVREHVDALKETGLAPEIVSVGGTGTFELDAELDFVTELQAGSYVFMDGRYQEVLPGRFEPALTLLTTVLTVRERYAVCDTGMKSLTNEFGPPWSPDRQIKVARLSEEHAILTGPGVPGLRPGDKVTVIPSHGDTTLNLHDVYHVARDGEAFDQWPILAARRFR